MVQAVVHPKFSESLWRPHYMRGPVYKRVKEIAREKPWEKPESELGISDNPENDIEDPEQHRGHDQPGYRWH